MRHYGAPQRRASRQHNDRLSHAVLGGRRYPPRGCVTIFWGRCTVVCAKPAVLATVSSTGGACGYDKVYPSVLSVLEKTVLAKLVVRTSGRSAVICA